MIRERTITLTGFSTCTKRTLARSLTCDIMELYRHLVDDFLIQYSKSVQKKDFVIKNEKYVSAKLGKREYLSDSKSNDLMRKFYAYLDWKVRIPRIRHGNKSSIETLINEETLLLGMYLRNEKKEWIPRIVVTGSIGTDRNS